MQIAEKTGNWELLLQEFRCIADRNLPTFLSDKRSFKTIAARQFILFLLLAICLGWGATVSAQITINKSIATGNDDAEEAGPDATGSYSNGTMDLTSSDIELGHDFDQGAGYSTGTQKSGLRFTGMPIPKGATITEAYLIFRAISADYPNTNTETTHLTIKGQLIANASTFSTTRYDISNRTLTTNSTSWTPSS